MGTGAGRTGALEVPESSRDRTLWSESLWVSSRHGEVQGLAMGLVAVMEWGKDPGEARVLGVEVTQKDGWPWLRRGPLGGKG